MSQTNRSYTRAPVKAPKVSGLALKAFVAALESPAGGPIADKLLADSGYLDFLGLDAGACTPLPPPLPHPSPLPTTASPTALAAAAIDGADSSGERESVAAFAKAYKDGLSPVAVVEKIEVAVARAAADNMAFFIARKPEALMAAAVASAERHKRGAPLSALDGVPVVIKDELDIEGFATTLGTSFRKSIAAADSTIVARLKAAGALVVGKGNMNEIGINPIGLNPHWGACRNPYNRGHITGGSSSASAATVAAGLAPISIGADGGGSIRIPAALCGVVGLKATHGRIPETGIPPLCWTHGHAGPLGLTVADVAAAYAIIAGPDGHDTASDKQPPPSLDDLHSGDVAGLRIGVCRAYFEDADADVVKHCRDALNALEARGAKVVEIPPPDLNRILWSHAIIILSEMATGVRDDVLKDKSRFAYDSRTNLALGRRFSATDYVHAMRHRHGLTVEALKLMHDVDVIATPTTATTAPPIPESTLPDGESNLPVVDGLMRFIRMGNLTGFPAISVPCGFDANGLPIGFHVMGRPWEEHVLLRVAAVVEEAVEVRIPAWHTRLLA
jgi:Asp-tRNA(Asn)/Glu-tRNA(Gln) amidotransferase A subunit family amidase